VSQAPTDAEGGSGAADGGLLPELSGEELEALDPKELQAEVHILNPR